MKVLAIGNSFSTDATRYLHQIARSCKVDIDVMNLYIGGCPLSLHYRNMIADANAYLLEFDGKSTGYKISISEALLSNDWDYISLQQVSGKSVDYETYQPYLNELYDYVKYYCPKAKIIIHQTWGYKDGTENLANINFATGSDMFAAAEKAYALAAKEINADLVIPSGKALEGLKANGIYDYFRDNIHVSLGLGRFTLGLTWFKYLTGYDVTTVNYNDLDEEVDEKLLDIAKKVVSEI